MPETSSAFALCKIRQSISLLPCHIGESRVGIDQEMTAQLMQYSEKLQGVVLSFSNVKLERPVGAIMNEQPYIHCKVLADALVFRPREGMVLEGVVNKIGSNHIGMLFAGVFNGSVAASELPKGYVHNYAQDAWNGSDGSSIAVDDTVEAKVLRVHVAGGMIAIEASMRHTKKPLRRKSIEPTATTTPVEEKKPKKDKKEKKDKKHKEPKHPEPAEITEEEPVPSPVVSKKRKKDREAAAAALVKDEPVDEPIKKKKSKKSKKE